MSHYHTQAWAIRRTVLVVESDDDVRSLTRILLAKRGYCVLEAPGPEAALAVATECAVRVDLLIAQVAAAGPDGPELAAQMRACHPGLKVLFVAERPFDSTVRPVLRKRETELIRRPFSLRDMANRVGALMATDCRGVAHDEASAAMSR